MIEVLARIVGAIVATTVLYPVAMHSPTVYIGVFVGVVWLACITALLPAD